LWLVWPHALGWYHGRAAQKAFDRQDFAAAYDHLAACLRVSPESASIHLSAARAARKLGFLDDAEEHLRACQRLEPEMSPETTLELTLLQITRSPMTSAQEKYLQDCLRHGCPDPLDLLEALTDQYMRRSRYVEAAPLLDAWLERRPDDVEALVRRGWVSDHLFDFAATRACYEKALAREPQRDAIRLRLAEILLLNNRAGEARMHLEMLRRTPSAPGVIVAYARCLDQLGEIDEAGRLLDELLTRYPENAQALSERGKVALDKREPSRAEIYLRKALELAPKDRQIVYYMSQSLEQQHKPAEARKYSEMLKQLDEDIKTVSSLLQDLMRTPHDANLRYRIGAIFLKNGQEDEAMHWFATALEENPVHRATHQTMADYYERAGNLERARKHRQIVATRASQP
jgi:tetratricopeptide (TPR) repeat protein